MIDQDFEEDTQVVAAKYLLNPEDDRAVDPETQARLEALLQAAGQYFFPLRECVYTGYLVSWGRLCVVIMDHPGFSFIDAYPPETCFLDNFFVRKNVFIKLVCKVDFFYRTRSKNDIF